MQSLFSSYDVRNYAILGCGFGGCCQSSPGYPPPLDRLKLNFDGSYIRDKNRGGIGGAIRDHDGVTIHNYLGPVSAFDANEAEIYSLLIGCRELKVLIGSRESKRLTAFNFIVEGD